ncbi:MAG: DUF2975 domain-containing protein [Candidatus Marinimicrobia bacterium]|jgi:hypothetical protein|nr:DUF2975 domain-containing protein [Candidatus Neomarinimicrobiota bacterium]MBT3676866.1 DUF2975 domain-containing protein [Candidatus Neomarinimicrobiota bacterium]MBT4068438.1 DUF2975 domain-containing protein [Candidatus Neomarinimicrobiota bacterium]MBT4271215.1 DUF2975 domain-containing protein [Candidatus Neomarinimicrobiota bacterium]MBT4372115.1 DUF2975 domain-containing protein [Candidatus Neomarinimicrobiota bacterium]
MSEHRVYLFIKITDGLITAITTLLALYIGYRFLMLLAGPVFGITDQTTKLLYPVHFNVEEEGVAEFSGRELPVKIAKAKAFALIESPTPEWLLIPVKLIRFSIFGFIIWILLLLRQLVRSVKKGDPFNMKNGNRLRWIGFSILIIGIFDFFHDILLNIFITPRLSFESIIPKSTIHFNLSLLLVAMIIIVIGEAFRIGAEMKEEQELTV